jgi:hypothetical protein
MKIDVKGKSYDVVDNSKTWSLKSTDDKLSIEYQVSKSNCPTLGDLQLFIQNELNILLNRPDEELPL